MPVNTTIKLVGKTKLSPDTYKFSCFTKDPTLLAATPGQFLTVQVSPTLDPLLKRHLSIYNLSRQENLLEFIFQIKGKGTQLLSQFPPQSLLSVLGPLGKGFTLPQTKNSSVAIIGGGIGIFPLYFLAQQAAQKQNLKVHLYLGFRSQSFVLLEKEFLPLATTFTLATDDGSYAQPGLIPDYLKKDLKSKKIAAIFACGPLPMLKAVQTLARTHRLPCQLSLEQSMACAVGACMGCPVKLVTPDQSLAYARVCSDGPVFDSSKVEL
jgi:dihydroorotate dehydrogenase electron transfer subunit